MRSEDLGGYYRVAADGRDLNYDKYFVKGEVHTQAPEELHQPQHPPLLNGGARSMDKLLSPDICERGAGRANGK